KNGKVDRRSLAALGGAAPEAVDTYMPPRGPVEEVLAGIWQEHIGNARVGARDDFFELGGHSLTAMRVISAIRYVFKVDLSISKIFEAPTIEGLARELTAIEVKPGRTEKIARIVLRIKSMSAEEKAERLREAEKGV
ncbi:MAG TPA: phosphopantetheine-binding protein, partial [Blastocatellia bacterium]|nr:phosphopantetheine-binding protein [Blastocatellia bacterium]